MSATMLELYTRTEVIVRAKEEFQRRRGSDFKYAALLGDRPPALDYRN
jgi:aminobenzoyl-glutamate utilization protein B